MLSGQLPSRIKAYDNAAEFGSAIPTFAHYLRSLGYYTCLAGKMHFIGPDQLHGFEDRLTTDIYPADFGWTPDWENPERPTWYHNMLSVVQAGECEATNQLDFDEEVAFRANRKLSQLARMRQADSRPFFMTVSFTHPHDPYAILPKYLNLYKSDEIDMPVVPPIPFEEMDPHSQRIYEVCAMYEYSQTPERVRAARHAYYGEISYIDEKVGQLLDTLESHGLRDNTLIIFTSDHGDMLGERGLWYKMSFFERAVRVPLIFHFPKQFPAHRVSAHVSLMDLLPTLVDLTKAGAPIEYADHLDGSSLTEFLKSEGEKGEDRVIKAEILSEGTIAPLVMIRSQNYKYIYSATDPEQLFNLKEDPHELKNLASSPEYKPVVEGFKEEVSKSWDISKLHREVINDQRRRRFIDKALHTGTYSSWDFQPTEKASEMYMRSHLDLNELERTARFPMPEIPPPDNKDQR
jgi:choline-sulfatase